MNHVLVALFRCDDSNSNNNIPEAATNWSFIVIVIHFHKKGQHHRLCKNSNSTSV